VGAGYFVVEPGAALDRESLADCTGVGFIFCLPDRCGFHFASQNQD
jgi:hypothetical protein